MESWSLTLNSVGPLKGQRGSGKRNSTKAGWIGHRWPNSRRRVGKAGLGEGNQLFFARARHCVDVLRIVRVDQIFHDFGDEVCVWRVDALALRSPQELVAVQTFGSAATNSLGDCAAFQHCPVAENLMLQCHS